MGKRKNKRPKKDKIKKSEYKEICLILLFGLFVAVVILAIVGLAIYWLL